MSKDVDEYLALRRQRMARCEKLARQVHGEFHNPELFAKEISALSTDELKVKVAGLETQLASLGDRRPNGLTSIPRTGKREDAQLNPNLFKI